MATASAASASVPLKHEVVSVDPLACEASSCCANFVQEGSPASAVNSALSALNASGSWYFVYQGKEAAVQDVVPSEMLLQSLPALLRGYCMTWKQTEEGIAESQLKEDSSKTCATGTAFRMSSEGAQQYEDFWLGPQPLASSSRIRLTMTTGQLLTATVLVPKLPMREENNYFSEIWFDACDEAESPFES